MPTSSKSLAEKLRNADRSTGVSSLLTFKARYQFSVDGGAVSTITPVDNVTIPNDTIIVGGTINSTTACTSGGAATIAVGLSAGGSTTSFLAATAVASFSADARLNSAATFAAPVKTTADGKITLTVATAALTAGVVEVTLFGQLALA
jgi:hypothetical protein